MIIAILGDTHIPARAERLPPALVSHLKDLEPDRIIFTGDATEYSVLFLLEEIAPLYAVKGNCDYGLELPSILSLKFKGRKFLVMHGHQFGRGNYPAMVEYAKGYDFLICGHTHSLKVEKMAGLWVLNPGSATGAWSGGGLRGEPTSLLLDLEEDVVEVWR